MAIHVTDSTFEKDVLKADQPTLVDFWAAWCQPCKYMEPVLEEVAKEYEGRAKVTKLNVDENPQVAQAFQVMSIPTIIIFKNGQPVDSIIGAVPKDKVTAKLNAAL